MMRSQNLKTEAYHATRPADRGKALNQAQQLRLDSIEDLGRQRLVIDGARQHHGADHGGKGGDRLLAPLFGRAVRHQAGQQLELLAGRLRKGRLRAGPHARHVRAHGGRRATAAGRVAVARGQIGVQDARARFLPCQPASDFFSASSLASIIKSSLDAK